MAKRNDISVLTRIREARAQMMIEGLSVFSGRTTQDEFEEAFDEYATPQRRHLVKMADEQLAELLATEPNTSYLHHLAASILRSRESWRTPARWALMLSGLSFVVSIIALWRSI